MAATLLEIGRIYLLIGGMAAAVFVLWGIGRVEPNARGAWAFRPLIVPGVVLVWPLVLLRWWRLERGPDEAARYRPPRRAQDGVAMVLVLAIPVILTVSLLVRQNGPLERPAEPLDTAEAEG